MFNKKIFLLLFFISVIFILPLCAFAGNGEIDSVSKYAWGENMGWINFAPSNNGVYSGLVVSDSSVSGYAWSGLYGWINFSPTNSGQGVKNTKNGTLTGYAWSESLGWINMAGVTIGVDGKFKGTAGVINTTAGRISFDCDKCAVVTNWLPTIVSEDTTPVPTQTSTPRSGGGLIKNTYDLQSTPPVVVSKNPIDNINRVLTDTGLSTEIQPKKTVLKTVDHVESYNIPLAVLPTQTGTFVSEYLNGSHSVAVIDIPKNTVPEKITINIVQHQDTSTQAITPTEYALINNGTVFDITAKTSKGEFVHMFKEPLKISLSIPDILLGKKDLGVYWYDEVNKNWVNIPDVVFNDKSVTFFVSHLTKFAVLSKTVPVQTQTPASPISSWNSYPKNLIIICVLFVLLFLLLKTNKKK